MYESCIYEHNVTDKKNTNIMLINNKLCKFQISEFMKCAHKHPYISPHV